MFNASELSTAVKYGINVITIVFRNDSYGNVARDLDEMFGGTYETDLHNPDFVKFAESFGAVGMGRTTLWSWRRSFRWRWSVGPRWSSTCPSERCRYRAPPRSRPSTTCPGHSPRRD